MRRQHVTTWRAWLQGEGALGFLSPQRTHYLREPFVREPDFGVTSVNYDFADLLARAEVPG